MLALGVLAAVAWAAAGDTQLVSRASGAGGPRADAAVQLGDISADGRFVVFTSTADNLASGGGTGSQDVFVRDTLTATTTLISRGLGGKPAAGNSSAPQISADGRYVAFQSSADNLHVEDSDTVLDIFVHDTQTGTLTLASRSSGITGQKGNDLSSAASISADGRHVAFSSNATNLPDDDDNTNDVFVRDLDTNTTTLVSRANGLTGEKGNGTSTAPSVSADGRMVAFASSAVNLPDDADPFTSVFVRDVVAGRRRSRAGRTARTARTALALRRERRSSRPAAASSRSAPRPPTSAAPRPRPRRSSATSRPRRRRWRAARSPARRPAAVRSRPGSRPTGGSSRSPRARPTCIRTTPTTQFDVFVRDLSTSTTALVSRASGAAGPNANGNATQPAISADGVFVAFDSAATNLHPDDDDTIVHVFTRQLGLAAPPPPPPPPPRDTAPPPPAGPAVRIAPVAGRSEVVQVVSGVIRVRQRGSRRFVRVRADTLIQDGSEIDATRGVLRLVVAAVRDGSRTASALVSRGRAIVDQNRAARPLTTLRLSGPLTTGPPRERRPAPQERRRGSRSLFTETDGGRFRTRGTYGAATASGTAWLTTDRATTTKITVAEGRVRVRDLVRRRTITVRAPNSYTARRNARRR